MNEMKVNEILTYILPTVVALLASWKVFAPVLRMAKLKQLVDAQKRNDLQQTAVPVMGGMAVYFGMICGVLLAACLTDLSALVPLLAGMTILMLVGMLDDMLDIAPMKRLVLEVLVLAGMIYGSGQCVDSLQGLFGIGCYSWWVAVPFTLFAGAGIINAINMIDGVNGLSSGLCITCCGLFAWTFASEGDVTDALVNLLMAAALVPFWIHNVLGKRSRMFIGDAGTMAMGTLMCWNVIRLLSSSPLSTLNSPLSTPTPSLVLSILAVPVLDTLRVMGQRMANRRSPFSADLNHLHHMIFDYSHSHSITAGSEILLTLVIFAIGRLADGCGLSVTGQFLVVLGAAMLLAWGTYFLLAYHIRRNTGFAYRVRKVMAGMRKGETKWWKRLQEWVDGGTIDNLY